LDIKRFLGKQKLAITKDIEKQFKKIAIDDKTKQTIAAAILAMQDQELTSLIEPILEQIYTDSTLVAGRDTTYQASNKDVFQGYAKEYAEQRTADLVTSLDDTTKTMLQNDLQSYMDQGLSPKQIATNLQSNYAFSESRALTIARTETGFCWNSAAIATYKLGGAPGVKVFDGDYDEICTESNGQYWSFSYAEDHLLEHPNCVRSFGIMPDNETLDEE